MDETNNPSTTETLFNVSDWNKKFKASEKIMKNEFLHKYKLAKIRLRAESDIENKNTLKMSHKNVNLVYSIGTSFVNSVYFKAPNCNLTAREEIDHEKVENTEIKVNDWLKDNKVKKIVQRLIWDAYLGGFGARFIDHEYNHIEDPSNVLSPEVPEQTDDLGNVIVPAKPAQFGRIVLKNEIIIQRIRPDLVRFPKGFDFDNFQDSPWIGFDEIKPISEIHSNENWDKTARVKIEGEKYDRVSDIENRTATQSDSDDLYGRISYVFIKPETELDKFKLVVFCHKYQEAPLQQVEFEKGHVGYPIKFIYFNPLDDDCSYPNGDPWNFESMSKAIDTWWAKMFNHVKRSNPKTFYDSGAVTKEEIQKAKSSNDLEFVGISNTQKRSLQDYFFEKERAQVHPDVTNLYQVARQLQSEIGPRSGLSRGAEDKQVDTATEAKIIQTGEVIDVESRIDVVSDFIKDIVLDVAGILEKSMEAPIPIRKPIIDPETSQPTGEEEIVEVNKTGFTSKINVDVEVESMQAQNKDVLFRQLSDLFQIIIKLEPILNKIGKTINPKFWIERILETRNIRNIEEGIMDLPPQPMMGPDGQPVMASPEPIQNGMGQDVIDDSLAARV